MARYDKVVPKNGVFRASLAAPFPQENLEKPYGVGLNAQGLLVIGAGVTGILGVLVLTKKQRAGARVDPMTHGEIVEFAPTAGEPGTDVGLPGKIYYAEADGDIVEEPADTTGLVRVGHTVEGQRLVVRVEP